MLLKQVDVPIGPGPLAILENLQKIWYEVGGYITIPRVGIDDTQDPRVHIVVVPEYRLTPEQFASYTMDRLYPSSFHTHPKNFSGLPTNQDLHQLIAGCKESLDRGCTFIRTNEVVIGKAGTCVLHIDPFRAIHQGGAGLTKLAALAQNDYQLTKIIKQNAPGSNFRDLVREYSSRLQLGYQGLVRLTYFPRRSPFTLKFAIFQPEHHDPVSIPSATKRKSRVSNDGHYKVNQ